MEYYSVIIRALALRLNKPMDQLGTTDTIDELLGGNSARRNQVLLDLGKEFGVGAIDGAHELGLAELGAQLTSAVGVRYSHPGPCLKTAQNEVLKALSLSRKDFLSLTQDWGLGPQRSESILTALAVHSDLQRPTRRMLLWQNMRPLKASKFSVHRWTRAALQWWMLAQSTNSKLKLRDHWKSVARAALRAADLDPSLVDRVATESKKSVLPSEERQSFDAKRYVAFTQGSQWVKADATQWFYAVQQGDYNAAADWMRAATAQTGHLLESLAAQHKMTQKGATLVKKVCKSIERTLKTPLRFAEEVAIITGAGPRSIAESIVTKLLEGGATVIVSCSRLSEARQAHFKSLYRKHAGRGSTLHVVPLNQGNLTDVAEFVNWIYKATSK